MNDYSHLEARIVASVKAKTRADTRFALFRSALISLRNIDLTWNAELRAIGNGYAPRLERFARGVERQLARNNPRAQMLMGALAAERVKARMK